MLEKKCRPSRKAIIAIFLVASLFAGSSASALTVTPSEAQRIGKQVWQNECGGTVAGLTSWNAGESFASLGIGHFIWYPAGARGPFEESFPRFVAFARDQGRAMPAWVAKATSCPWKSRAEFENAQNSSEMKELRTFLSQSVNLQAHFLVARLDQSLAKMLEAIAAGDRENVREQFERVGRASGAYPLVDYVNFKGEGVLASERYRGEGWGLLQVLSNMHGTETQNALDEFARSAKRVLQRRVQNSPPERNESRWLPGWLHRVNSYAK